MMMTYRHLPRAAAALLLGAATLSAQALSVAHTSASSTHVIGQAEALGQQLALDLQFNAAGSYTVVLQLEADDLGQWLGLNAVLTLGNGLVLQTLSLSMLNLQVLQEGTVTPQFGVLQSVNDASTTQIDLHFNPVETLGVDLGNPFGQAGAQDWLLAADDLAQAGDTVTLKLAISAVPEPATAGLWLAGAAALVAWALRRRA